MTLTSKFTPGAVLPLAQIVRQKIATYTNELRLDVHCDKTTRGLGHSIEIKNCRGDRRGIRPYSCNPKNDSGRLNGQSP